MGCTGPTTETTTHTVTTSDIRNNPVLASTHHFDEVRTAFLRYKADLRMEGIDIVGFATMIPKAVSTLEIGLPTNNDILLDGPFDESDERILPIQRNVIGHNTV